MIIDLHQDISVKLLEQGVGNFLKVKNTSKASKTYGKFGLVDQSDYFRLINNDYKVVFGASCALKLDSKGISIPKNPYAYLLTHLNSYLELQKYSKGKISIVKNIKDIDNLKKDTIGILLAIEGLYFITDKKDLKNIDSLYEIGVRCIGPFWNLKNSLGGGGSNIRKLTKLGKELIECLNKKNIIIDGSHACPPSLHDMLTISCKPIIVTHALTKSVFNHFRNLEDKHIRLLSSKGGVIGVCFVGDFSNENTIEMTVRHIQHLRKIASIDNIAIGSDFSAMFETSLVKDLEDASKIMNLITELKKIGFKSFEIEKIFWRNAYNFLKENLK